MAEQKEPRSARIGLSVTPSVKQELEKRAAEAGVPTSLLINMLIQAYLRDPRILPEL